MSCSAISSAPVVKVEEPKRKTTLFEKCQEVAFVALPFLSLYKPLSMPIAIGVTSIRCFSSLTEAVACYQKGDRKGLKHALIETAVYVASLIGTIVAHPLGMIILTLHDLIQNMKMMITALQEKNYKQAFESGAHIVSDLLFLSLFVYGSIECAIAFFAIQTCLGIYYSTESFRKGHYFRAAGHLGMSLIRGRQTHLQMQRLQFKRMLENLLNSVEVAKGPRTPSIPSKNVGELGAKWQFPSDHLPVGAKVGKAHVISWNVMNQEYIDWVHNNSQGLKGSQLTQLDQPSQLNPSITLREELVVKNLLEIINNPAHSEQLILSLQECRPQFLSVLQAALPANMEIIYSDPTMRRKDQDVIIYNRNTYSYLRDESGIVMGAYSRTGDERSLMDVVFQEKASGQKYQIINAHVPGDPAKPGRNDFARYVLSHPKEDCITVALGDMNFTGEEMNIAFQEEAKELNLPNSFVNKINYNTNINPGNFKSKSIDHLWVAEEPFHPVYEPMQPNEILSGLQATVDLLSRNTLQQEVLQQRALAEQRFHHLRHRQHAVSLI
jgi:hypothetical protein